MGGGGREMTKEHIVTLGMMDMLIILTEVTVLQVYKYVLTYQHVLLKYMQFRGTSLEYND